MWISKFKFLSLILARACGRRRCSQALNAISSFALQGVVESSDFYFHRRLTITHVLARKTVFWITCGSSLSPTLSWPPKKKAVYFMSKISLNVSSIYLSQYAKPINNYVLSSKTWRQTVRWIAKGNSHISNSLYCL